MFAVNFRSRRDFCGLKEGFLKFWVNENNFG